MYLELNSIPKEMLMLLNIQFHGSPMSIHPIYLKDLKSPKGHFLFGHLSQFNTSNKHQVIERWVKECGELFKINFFGKELIVSADIEFNHEVLKQRPHDFRRISKINEILTELGVVGVFNAEGDAWKRQRKLVSESLSAQKVNEFFPTIKEKTQNLLQLFRHYSSLNQSVDIRKDFMSYTIDITSAIAFGYDLDTINGTSSSFHKHLEHIFPMVNERITAPIPFWRIIKLKKDKELDKSLKSIESLIYEFIGKAKEKLKNREETNKIPSNFLEAILIENEEENISDKELYGNIFTLLLAGEDTTSNSISWIAYYLTQNPSIVLKIREEANMVFKDSEVPQSNDQMAQLEYTKAVVQEAIRLKPTTPQLYMESNRDIFINNIYIPKNTSIILQNKVGQTNEKYFSEANKFIPERWVESGCPMHEKHSPNVIKAFGGGPRNCPGRILATREMVCLIASLCKQFDMELAVNPEQVTEEFTFTMHPGNLMIRLKLV